jgi:hypothetical protein
MFGSLPVSTSVFVSWLVNTVTPNHRDTMAGLRRGLLGRFSARIIRCRRPCES